MYQIKPALVKSLIIGLIIKKSSVWIPNWMVSGVKRGSKPNHSSQALERLGPSFLQRLQSVFPKYVLTLFRNFSSSTSRDVRRSKQTNCETKNANSIGNPSLHPHILQHSANCRRSNRAQSKTSKLILIQLRPPLLLSSRHRMTLIFCSHATAFASLTVHLKVAAVVLPLFSPKKVKDQRAPEPINWWWLKKCIPERPSRLNKSKLARSIVISQKDRIGGAALRWSAGSNFRSREMQLAELIQFWGGLRWGEELGDAGMLIIQSRPFRSSPELRSEEVRALKRVSAVCLTFFVHRTRTFCNSCSFPFDLWSDWDVEHSGVWTFLAGFVPWISGVALKVEILFRLIAISNLMFYLIAANRCRRRQLNASPCVLRNRANSG